MRNTFTISSIANVILRFSGKATVMLRTVNALPATWPQHDCTGPRILGRGKPADQLLENFLEPSFAGNSVSTGIAGKSNLLRRSKCIYRCSVSFNQSVHFCFNELVNRLAKLA